MGRGPLETEFRRGERRRVAGRDSVRPRSALWARDHPFDFYEGHADLGQGLAQGADVVAEAVAEGVDNGGHGIEVDPQRAPGISTAQGGRCLPRRPPLSRLGRDYAESPQPWRPNDSVAGAAHVTGSDAA